MSSSTAAAAPSQGRARSRFDVLLPLLTAYFALAALYAWQAWRREVPTIFTDELEMTQISRSIAETGHPGRRGEPYAFTTLVPWLTAPGWWIGNAETAYATIKYLQMLVMTAAIFPAYLLARTVVSTRWAVAAAVATVVAPALSYAPILVEEPFAYPAAALALWLCVRMAASPSWGSFLLAAGACVLATLVRSQLIAFFPVLLVPLLVLGWQSDAMRRYRSTWSRGDWLGAVTLGIGALLFAMAFVGHRSADWAEMMALWKGRIVEYGVWAAGAFAIGIGVLPLIAALAVLARPREEYRDPGTRAYVLVSGSALFFLTFYAGLKGGYVSTRLGSYVVERNLIYLVPLAFVSTALLLERRNPRWWAVGAATAAVLYVVIDVPLRLDQYPYYEAHGLAILAFANRIFVWSEGTIEGVLIVLTVASGATLIVLGALRRPSRAATLVVACLAGGLLAWNLTAEIYAANGETRLSRRMASSFLEQRTWIDDEVGDASVTLVGQQFGGDTNGINLTEFFNRSIKKVWSVDPGSPAPGPGPTQTPDLVAATGELRPTPGTDYALTVNGVRLQSDVVRSVGTATLYRLAGPLQLEENQTGVASDGWMGRHAAYNRFAAHPAGPGFARVTVDRIAFCTGKRLPGRTVIRIGPLTIGPDKQPSLSDVTDTRVVQVPPCQSRTVLLRPPPGPWRIEVDAQTFVPAEVDPRLSERRAFGVRPSFGFVAL